MSEVKFKLAAGTNVGLIRTNNEDNFIVCPDLNTSEWLIPQDGDYAVLGELGALLVVADGMGGANAGEVASAIAVQTIQQLFVPENIRGLVNDDKAVQQFMKDVVKSADLNILNQSKQDASASGMGTTVVMAWLLGHRVYVCWCGDSRCYAYNQSRGLLQVSKDHSYVQELVDQGELDPEFMHDHPLSNVITRCLGDAEKRANPDTKVYELYDGDSILLCSDGLSGLCYDDQITEIVKEFADRPMDCKNELISAALSNGGHDNVTVALCTVKMANDMEQTVRPKDVRSKVTKGAGDSLNDTVKSLGSSVTKKKFTKHKKTEFEEVENPIREVDTVVPCGVEAPVVEPPKAEKAIGESVAADVTSDTENPVVNLTEDNEQDKEAETLAADDSTKLEVEAVVETEDNVTEDSGNVKATVEPEPPVQTKKKNSYRKLLLFFLLLLLIAACCIYFIPECAPLRDSIMKVLEGTTGSSQ